MPKTILIAEDDHAIRVMVRSVLSREGYDVDDVDSGNEAITRLGEKYYDAVVLDVAMADGSGHDVLAALAEQRPDVKCVVIISAGSPVILEKVPGANVQAKLRKPFDIHELVAAVETCVAAADVDRYSIR